MCRFLVEIIIVLCVFNMSLFGDNMGNYCVCNEEGEEANDYQKEITTVTNPDNSNTCPQESQNVKSLVNQTIKWPETESGKYAISDPLCIDESLKIVKRFCNDDLDKWDDVPNCKFVQQPINPCPPGFLSLYAMYCYNIIEKTKFPPDCPYPGEMGWQTIIDIGILPEGPVWMPLKRTDSVERGIDVLRYTEISDKYNAPFQICTQSCRTFFYRDTFLDKQCQVYHNSTHIEAVSCDAEYAAICIYDALTHKPSSLCSQNYKSCKQGGYRADSICFCKTTEPVVGQTALAEFLEPHQSLLFKDESCRIGLQNTKDESNIPFVWMNSRSILNYTSWSPNVDFNNKFGIQTPDGWTLSNNNGSCFLYQIEAPITNANLSLAIEKTSYKLTLTNYTSFLTFNNEHPVVFCYTDADAQSIIYQIPNDPAEVSVTDNEYTIKFLPISLDQSGPGNYWCTAFLYPDLNPITSERVIIRNFYAEYVVILKLKKYEEKLSKYPLTTENLQTLQNLFRNELPSNITFYPRIFKINAIDEIKKEIDITFHLTSSEASSTLEEFYELKNISKSQTLFELLDFRSVLYCPESVTIQGGHQIIWPSIEAVSGPTSTYPSNGLCVTHDVSLIKRTCSGNFVDGVSWSDITELCDYFPVSNLTYTLIRILYRDEDNRIDSELNKLYNVSKEYYNFNTLDFGLAVKIIMKLSSEKVDLDVLAATISNLMNIPRVILLSAQINFKSTDTLLKSIDTIWQNGDFGAWDTLNFAVRSINLKTETILGYQLQTSNASTGYVLNPIKNSNVLCNETIIRQNKVNSAITLSTKLHQQILNYQSANETYLPKLIITFYYGSQLFVETENSKSSNVVFGVLLPEFPQEKTFEGPVSMYYYTNVKSKFLQYNCSYWSFNESTAGNWAIENTDELAEAVVCEFYHLTNFGVPTTTLHPMCLPDEEFFCNEISLDGHCMTGDLTLIPTKCFKNFTGKAHISTISKNCTKYRMSSNKIKNIVKASSENATYDLVLVMLDTLNSASGFISEVEFAMVVWFMKIISGNSGHIVMSKFAAIVNKLTLVPKSILSNAQRNFRGMDLLLPIIEQTMSHGGIGNWETDNVIIQTFQIDDDHMGIALENYSIDPIHCDTRFIGSNSYSMPTSNTYAHLLLSDDLYNQIISYSKANSSYIPKLVISIYYNSNLFVDIELPDQKTSMVFDVLLPEFNQTFQGPFTIYFFNNSSTQYDCSYWKFDSITYGSWKAESSSSNWDNVTVCDFYHLTHFALNSKRVTSLSHFDMDNEDFTNLGMENFQCDSASCSNNFLERDFGNVFLDLAYFNFSKNLEPSVMTLELLADMIGNFEASVFKSSDTILHNIDRVLSNIEDTNYINKEQIAFITISKEHAQHFQGFYVTNEKDIVCIYQEENFKDLDFNIAVVLDPKLRHQIKEANSNIAFAIFYNDALFSNSKNSQLPIIAVLIPNLPPNNLKGNISIKYKTSKKGFCSYWHHPGFWQKESKADLLNNISTCNFNHVTHFALVYDLQNITKNLQQILDSNLTAREKLFQVHSITASNPNDLVAVDIYLVSQIITGSLSEVVLPEIISKIISSLFTVPRDVLRESQEVHSATDIILYTVDQMATQIDDIETQHCNFSLIVKDLNLVNLTGILLHDCEGYRCNIEMLHEFINISDYSRNSSISAMVLFSEDLVKQIRNNSDKPKIVISMYDNDALFNEVSSPIRNTSKIFGVIFPELNDELQGTVSIIFNVGNTNTTDLNQCAHWHYQADPSGNNFTHGRWKNDSNRQRDNSMVICNYTHVTHLGMLLSNSDEFDNDPVLDLITDIGCILSLFGIIIILLTALFYKKWRRNTGNIILINFSIAIMLKIITLYVSVYLKSTALNLFCTVTGIFLHYATLSECAWMLTVAILQFKRFVEVLGGPPKYVLVKALICGWVFPVIPVIVVVAIDPNNYQEGFASLCYPSDLGLYLGVWLPVLLILTINCIIFTFIVYNVFHKKTEYIDNSNHEILFQWRLALLLFFMLGLNGVFGFVGQIHADAIFIYLYTITGSLQGFVLFLFFIVFNKSTRFLYSQSIKQWFYARGFFRLWKHNNSKPATKY